MTDRCRISLLQTIEIVSWTHTFDDVTSSSPWNPPFYLPTGVAVAAMQAGHTIGGGKLNWRSFVGVIQMGLVPPGETAGMGVSGTLRITVANPGTAVLTVTGSGASWTSGAYSLTIGTHTFHVANYSLVPAYPGLTFAFGGGAPVIVGIDTVYWEKTA